MISIITFLNLKIIKAKYEKGKISVPGELSCKLDIFEKWGKFQKVDIFEKMDSYGKVDILQFVPTAESDLNLNKN